MIIIAEIKAKCSNQEAIRNILKKHRAICKGTDHQIDTYFKVNEGRLKLREGGLENNLIQYNRENKSGPKKSKVNLYKTSKDAALKKVLTAANGVLTVVDKKREIYFIDNVKFHIDKVFGLGDYIEIEAIGEKDYDSLLAQCEHYMELFSIKPADLIDCSYSDLLLSAQHGG